MNCKKCSEQLPADNPTFKTFCKKCYINCTYKRKCTECFEPKINIKNKDGTLNTFTTCYDCHIKKINSQDTCERINVAL